MADESAIKDVCVIGAGWSGLYALKYASQRGLDCVAIEQRETIGGLWGYDENTKYTTVADITYTSSPKLFTEATDFPWKDEWGSHPKHTDVYEWLQSYAAHFNLVDKVLLKTTVEGTTKENGVWKVHITDRATNKSSVISCKNLVVATGVNGAVNDLSNTEKYKNFTGEKIHSDVIRNIPDFQKKMEGKNIVSIGGGENGSDLAYHFSKKTKSYHHCIPNGHWMQIRCAATLAVPIPDLYPVTDEKMRVGKPWEYQKIPFRNIIRPMWGSNVSLT